MRSALTLIAVSAAVFLSAEGLMAAQQTQAVAEPQAKGGHEQLICRRIQHTGSLARMRRLCYTKAEWDRIAEAARANTQRMQTDHTGAGMISN